MNTLRSVQNVPQGWHLVGRKGLVVDSLSRDDVDHFLSSGHGIILRKNLTMRLTLDLQRFLKSVFLFLVFLILLLMAS